MKRCKRKIRLIRKVFLQVFTAVLTILGLTCLAIFSLSYQKSVASAKYSTDLLMEQNSIILNNLISSVEETMLSISNDIQLYNLLNYEDSGTHVDRLLVKQDLSAYVINMLVLPVQQHITSVECHYIIPKQYPVEELFRNISFREGRIHSWQNVQDEPWYLYLDEHKTGDVYWFIEPENPGIICAAANVLGFFESVSVQHAGMVLVRFDVSDLFLQVSDSTLTQNSKYFLIDPQENWYSSHGSPLAAEDVPDQIQYVPGIQTISFHSDAHLFRLSTLSNGWYFASLTPYSDILAETKYLLQLFLTILVIGVVVSFLFSFSVSHRISRPILKLSDTMLALRNESELTQEFTGDSNIVEISDLYTSFQTLILRIRALIEDIHQKGINEKKAEIKALQAQINPHFLFNTLDSLCWAARDTGDQELPEAITSLSDILRYSLRNFDQQVGIEEELQIVRQYVKIQQFCYNLDVTLVEDVAPDVLECRLPKLTLQPLVENAILHGMLEHGEHSDTVSIRASRRDGKISIQVENSFPADTNRMVQIVNDTAQVEKHGIKNVHCRLRMLYGEEYGLQFFPSETGGVVVEIVLPA